MVLNFEVLEEKDFFVVKEKILDIVVPVMDNVKSIKKRRKFMYLNKVYMYLLYFDYQGK